jgi:hypothetical protein
MSLSLKVLDSSPHQGQRRMKEMLAPAVWRGHFLCQTRGELSLRGRPFFSDLINFKSVCPSFFWPYLASRSNFGVTSQRFSLIKIATMKALAVSCCLFLLPILAFGQGERVNDLGKRAKLLLEHGQWEAAHRLLGEKLRKKRFRKSAALWLYNARACQRIEDVSNNYSIDNRLYLDWPMPHNSRGATDFCSCPNNYCGCPTDFCSSPNNYCGNPTDYCSSPCNFCGCPTGFCSSPNNYCGNPINYCSYPNNYCGNPIDYCSCPNNYCGNPIDFCSYPHNFFGRHNNRCNRA